MISFDTNVLVYATAALATAQRAGVRHMLSEDFQDGFELQNVTFINPFNFENNQLIDKLLPQS